MNLSEVDVYLRNLRDSIATVQEESSASEKLLLACNVFEQIEEHISTLATHQVLSKYVEKLIALLAHSLIEDPQSEFAEKQRLCTNLASQLLVRSDVEVLSKDVFGSHVLQSTLQCCTLFEQHGISLSDSLQYFAATIEDHCLFELLHHISGSHVLRSLIKTMSGALDADAFQKSKRKATVTATDLLVHSKHPLDNWRLSCMQRWSTLFCKDLDGVLSTSQACATLCLLLKLYQENASEDASSLCKDVLCHCFSRCSESKTASFAAEQCLEFCQNADFNHVFKAFVLPQAQELAENQFGNYVVQAIVRHHFFQASHLEGMLEEINIGSLLLSSSASVVWRLCESAVTLGTGQSLFMKKLMDALGVTQYTHKRAQTKISDTNRTNKADKKTLGKDVTAASGAVNSDDAASETDPKESDGRGYIWLALVSCQPVESQRIHLRATGTSILLNLLKFDRNIIGNILSDFKYFLKIAKSQNFMVTLASDRHFSRVLQLMLDRRQGLLKEKQILKMFKYLKAHFVEVAMDINGAFVLSSLFNACPVQQQHELLAELAPEGDRIQKKNKRFAEIIGLEAFRKNENLWMNKRKKTESVRTLFKDIIEPTS